MPSQGNELPVIAADSAQLADRRAEEEQLPTSAKSLWADPFGIRPIAFCPRMVASTWRGIGRPRVLRTWNRRMFYPT